MVSFGFERLQATPPFSWATDSGFSAEDLVSNLIGFYGVHRLPSEDRLRQIAGEVSATESQRIWDEHLPKGIGALKNRRFRSIMFPTMKGGAGDNGWPVEFTGIVPAGEGVDWAAVEGRFIDGGLLSLRRPLAATAGGRVTLAAPQAAPAMRRR